MISGLPITRSRSSTRSTSVGFGKKAPPTTGFDPEVSDTHNTNRSSGSKRPSQNCQLVGRGLRSDQIGSRERSGAFFDPWFGP